MSAYEYGAGIHILGYGINIDDKGLHKFFKTQNNERKKVFEKYAACFKKAGFKINRKIYNQYKKMGSATKAHVFQLIWSVTKNHKLALARGLTENKKAPTPFNFQSPFINMFMTFPGQIAYVRKKQVSAQKVIVLIHKIGGVAVWAHPGLEMEFKKNLDLFPKVLKKLLSYGLDGLEAYSTSDPQVLPYGNEA